MIGLDAARSLAEIDTPAVLVDLDVMERNLERMASLCREHGLDLWPHAKSHKVPQLARRQLAAGAAGITCQKLGEAEVMAAAGIEPLLVSYPIIGPIKVQRLIRLAGRVRVTTVVDSVAGAEAIGRAAAQRGLAVDTLLDVDVGYRRCGVAPQHALAAAETVAALPGLRLVGVMAYEGHIYDRPGAGPAAERAAEAYERLGTVVAELRAAGMAVPRVSVGATAAAAVAGQHPVVNELRAGSYLFNDLTQVAMGVATEADCALTVLTTVVSSAAGGHVVIDAGSKALSYTPLVGAQSYGAVAGCPDLVVGRLSDEHGMIPVESGPAPTLGDRLRLIPVAHAAVVDNFSTAVAVRGQVPVDKFRIAARGCMH